MTVRPQQPVLVGVDDAGDGLLAARVGAAEARLHGLPLHLLSSCPPCGAHVSGTDRGSAQTKIITSRQAR